MSSLFWKIRHPEDFTEAGEQIIPPADESLLVRVEKLEAAAEGKV